MSTTYQVVLIVGCSSEIFCDVLMANASVEGRHQLLDDMRWDEFDIETHLPSGVDCYDNHVGIVIDASTGAITLDKDTMQRIEDARAVFRSKVGITGEPYFVLYSY